MACFETCEQRERPIMLGCCSNGRSGPALSGYSPLHVLASALIALLPLSSAQSLAFCPCSLVPQLLDALITLLPLPSTQPKSKRATVQQQPSPKPSSSSSAAAAAAAAESRATGTQASGRWSLADGLRQSGAPHFTSSLLDRLLAKQQAGRSLHDLWAVQPLLRMGVDPARSRLQDKGLLLAF